MTTQASPKTSSRTAGPGLILGLMGMVTVTAALISTPFLTGAAGALTGLSGVGAIVLLSLACGIAAGVALVTLRAQLLREQPVPPADPNQAASVASMYDTLSHTSNPSELAETLFELSETQTKLVRTEGRYRELVENVPFGLWVRDLTVDHFTYLSPEFQRLTGYSLAQVRCLPNANDVFHMDDRPQLQALLDAVDRSGEFDFIGRIVKASGEAIQVHTSVRLIRDNAGRPLRLIGTLAQHDGVVTNQPLTDRPAPHQVH